MKYLFNRIVVSTLVALSPVFAMAQTWSPTEDIIFLGFVAPGSSNDLIARMLSEKLPAKLGQLALVNNRSGASGLVVAASVASSPPDGQAIVIVPSDVYMAPILSSKAGGANFDNIKDFSPILTSGKILERYTGTQLNHVPYHDALPAINAVLAGELSIFIAAFERSAPHIAAGKVVPLGLVEKQRSEVISNLPTVTESGIAGVEIALFFQIFAPAATPAAAIQGLNTDINAVFTTSESMDKLRGMGVQIKGGTSGDTAKLARDIHTRNQQTVKHLIITVECATS